MTMQHHSVGSSGRLLHRVLFCLGVCAFALFPSKAASQETAAFFKQNCASCHTIGGGRLTGPDLKNVSQRKEHDWLVAFVINPKTILDSGDSYAVKLRKDYGGIDMPVVFGLTKDRAESLLKLIEDESKLERSQFAGAPLTDRPWTAAGAAQGHDIFLGVTPLSKGGAACISCHTIAGLSPMRGGKLGPDLTRVFEKMQTRKQFAAWLSAPATPTMAPIYKNHPLEPDEILALVDLFEHTKETGADDAVASMNFFLLGLGGTVVGLVGFDYVWRRRFRAVRRFLAPGQEKKGDA
ncbi:MAG TPA: c-type cytochrome [Gemmataceae bacterium]|nr:c-type cytochrome [Gemmataceae bacterium]